MRFGYSHTDQCQTQNEGCGFCGGLQAFKEKGWCRSSKCSNGGRFEVLRSAAGEEYEAIVGEEYEAIRVMFKIQKIRGGGGGDDVWRWRRG
ncbi:hypothetical protein L6452_20852 [Arctium lappa]|uniref:Uncharacterized protein n=1 Tax=Arctium lappa TaxID=4217 RepID=A0ACB9BCI6_ARCLA|nr:hypothetical protein L6452_20852 [Arctium lappa]